MKKLNLLFLFTGFSFLVSHELFGSNLHYWDDEEKENIDPNLQLQPIYKNIPSFCDLSNKPKQRSNLQRSGSFVGEDLLKVMQIPSENFCSSKRKKTPKHEEMSNNVPRTRSFDFGRFEDRVEYGSTPQEFMNSLEIKASQENLTSKKAKSIKNFRAKEQEWLESALRKKEVGEELTLGEESAYNKYREILE